MFLIIISNSEWHNKLSKSIKHSQSTLEFVEPKFPDLAIISLLLISYSEILDSLKLEITSEVFARE